MYGTIIKSVKAQQVYTNRGKPGVEVVVTTENGAQGRAMCTSGVSIGTHEVDFTFDGGTKFGGKGVTGAAKRVEDIIAPVIIGMDSANQAEVDRAILGIMPDAKLKLGGNAVAATSAAVLKAGANALGIPLYRHIGGANAMYLPVPGVAMVAGDERYGGGITTPGGKPTMSVMAFGFDTFSDASYACWEVHTRWAEKMKKKFGGLPNIRDFISVPAGIYNSDREIWEDMLKTINEAGYEGKMGFQMDVATDTYHNKEDDKYYGLFDATPKTKEQLYDFYMQIIKDYPFVIIEDPFNEDDYDTTAALTKECGIQIVGDDLFTTNPERVAYGISKEAANTVLLIGDFKSICAMQSTVVKERMKLDCDEYEPVLVDDITSFVAKLEGDVIANFMVTKCALGEGNTIIYELYGTKGVIKFNLNNPDEIALCLDVDYNDRETVKAETISVPTEYKLGEQECFIRTLHGENLPYFPDIKEGLKAQEVVDAALKSAETQEMVKL